MGLFRALFANREPNPEWAATLDREGYLRFLAILRRRLAREGRAYTIDALNGEFHFDETPDAHFGLWNLAQQCRHNGGRDWVEIIDDHVTRVLSFNTSESSVPEAFEEAKPLLFPCVYPVDLAVDGMAEVDVCSAFRTIICCDFPEIVSGVTERDAERWQKTSEELYEISLQNLWRTQRYDAHAYEHPGGTLYIVAEDTTLLVAPHALQLNRYMFPDPEHGALLAIPNRHSFIFEPITGPLDPNVVPQLLALAHRGYVSGPGSISPSLLWYRDGSITALDVDENGVIIGPDAAKGTPLISDETA